jgi:iron complex transport system substrate-binding protein
MKVFNMVAAAAAGFCTLVSSAAFADAIKVTDVTGR